MLLIQIESESRPGSPCYMLGLDGERSVAEATPYPNEDACQRALAEIILSVKEDRNDLWCWDRKGQESLLSRLSKAKFVSLRLANDLRRAEKRDRIRTIQTLS